MCCESPKRAKTNDVKANDVTSRDQFAGDVSNIDSLKYVCFYSIHTYISLSIIDKIFIICSQRHLLFIRGKSDMNATLSSRAGACTSSTAFCSAWCRAKDSCSCPSLVPWAAPADIALP